MFLSFSWWNNLPPLSFDASSLRRCNHEIVVYCWRRHHGGLPRVQPVIVMPPAPTATTTALVHPSPAPAQPQQQALPAPASAQPAPAPAPPKSRGVTVFTAVYGQRGVQYEEQETAAFRPATILGTQPTNQGLSWSAVPSWQPAPAPQERPMGNTTAVAMATYVGSAAPAQRRVEYGQQETSFGGQATGSGSAAAAQGNMSTTAVAMVRQQPPHHQGANQQHQQQQRQQAHPQFTGGDTAAMEFFE